MNDFVKIGPEFKTSGIYAITYKHTSGDKKKYYIGSSVYMWQRLQKHFSCLRNKTHQNPIMQNYFNKYGEKFFKVELIEVTKNLIRREQHYINKLKPEFNIVQDVIRAKLPQSSIDKISSTLSLKYKLGILVNPKKKVKQYSLTGKYLKTFKSLTEAAKAVGLSNTTKISNVCTGLRKHAAGYQWRYKDKDRKVKNILSSKLTLNGCVKITVKFKKELREFTSILKFYNFLKARKQTEKITVSIKYKGIM